MRRLLYFIMSLLPFIAANSQPIVSYDLETKTGSYEEITGATVVKSYSGVERTEINDIAFWGTGTEVTESKTGPGIPIGFDFQYNDTYMNQFVIGGNFYIALGKDEITLDPSSSFHKVGGTGSNTLGNTYINDVFNNNDTEISYKLDGEAPNRVLTIQFKDMGISTNLWDPEMYKIVNFQIKLYETSNNIEFIYKDWNVENGNNLSFHVGLVGTTDNDLMLLYDNWDTPEIANNISNMMLSPDSYPKDGQTYTFIPAPTCEVPASQPTDLVLTPSSISVSGSFTETVDADHYLVLMSESATLTEMPQEGLTYEAGQTLGNSTVIAYGTENTFTTPSSITLDGAKEYHFFVIGVNAFCAFGPKYNTTNPLTASVTTMPGKPETLAVTEEGYNEVTLSVTPNSNNDRFIIATTTEYARDHVNNILIDGKFGQPTKDQQVGDMIEGGGKIVYIGNETTVKIGELSENTLHHFMAWSIDGNGNVSTTGATANVLTWGKVPYKPDFTQMPPYTTPFGWDTEGNELRLEGDYSITCKIGQNASGTVNAMTSPWILLKETQNRVLLDYNMQIPGSWGSAGTAYNDWDEKDLFAILVTADEVKFDTIYKATSANRMYQDGVDTYNRIYAAFDQYAGQKVKVKIYWKGYRNVWLTINYFEVEEKLPCDYPINLTATDVVSDKATIGWTSQGEENLWEIRWRKATGEDGVENEWSTPVETKTNPYTIAGLPSKQDIEVEVRAKCSASSMSNWSKSLTFKSGYSIPFTENFTDAEMPSGWEFRVGALATPTEFITDGSVESQWNFTGRMKKYLTIQGSQNTADDWLVFPQLDFGDGSVNYLLILDMENMQPSADNDETYSIVASKDGGKTFNEDDVIYTINKSELPTGDGPISYQIRVNGMKGIVRLALYVKSTTGKVSTMVINSIAVIESCPTDVVATVSDITESGAKVTWDGTKDEDQKWLVFTRQQGSSEKNFTEQDAAELVLTDLEPRTAYEVGITKSCAPGDTARVVIASFTTLATEECPQVEDIEVTTTQYTAEISWFAAAMKYNVRYRMQGTEEWTVKTTTETSLLLEGLEAETTYEYGIQTVCSNAEGDVSEYTETATFQTLAVTCFPPTDIMVEPTYKSAKVTWQGEADHYEIAIRKDKEEWTSQIVNAKEYEYTELEAETNYGIRIRSICSETDMSLWSEVVEFKTPAIPECTIPFNLRAESVTENEAQVAWDADDSNLTWDLRYREGSSTSWNNVTALTEKTYTLKDLKPETAYLWTVKATCDEGRTSAWAANVRFETEKGGIEETGTDALNVFAADKMLNVINDGMVWIENIAVYSLSGQMLKLYEIDSDENVLIQTAMEQKEVIVKVNGKGWSKAFHILFR